MHTEGEDGLRRETYEVTVVDGEEAARELVADQVIRKPTDRIVLVGVGQPGPVREAQSLSPTSATRWAPSTGSRATGASRTGLQPGELDALRATSGLPAATLRAEV